MSEVIGTLLKEVKLNGKEGIVLALTGVAVLAVVEIEKNATEAILNNVV